MEGSDFQEISGIGEETFRKEIEGNERNLKGNMRTKGNNSLISPSQSGLFKSSFGVMYLKNISFCFVFGISLKYVITMI